MSEMLIPFKENPKTCVLLFFTSFHRFLLFDEKVSTHLTMLCLRCIFRIDNHKDLIDTVTFVERISDQNSTS